MNMFVKLIRSSASFFALLVSASLAALFTIVLPLLAEEVASGSAPAFLFVLHVVLLVALLLAAFFGLVFLIRSSRRTLLSADTLAQYEKQGFASLALQVLILCGVLGAVALFASILYGFISLLIYNMASPVYGLQEIKGIIGVATQLITVAAAPLILVLWAGLTLCGLSIKQNLQRALRGFGRAYIPLWSLLVASLGLGYLLWTVLGFIDNEALHTALSLIAFSLVGAVFLPAALTVCALVLPQKSTEGITGELPSESQQTLLSAKEAGYIRVGISCALSLVLALSLLGTALPALAVPKDEPAGTTQTPPQEFEQQGSSNAGLISPAPNAPGAQEPLAYYPEEDQAGVIVAADEQSVTYQINEREFTTVIGGVAQTYTDDAGELQLINNTLEATQTAEGAAYENIANSFVATLPTQITDDSGVKIVQDGTGIEIIPLDGDFSRFAAKDNAARYTEVFAGIDYQYTIVGSVIKEDIVLNHTVERTTFKSQIKLGELLGVKEENGAIVVFWLDSKEVYVTLSAPLMIDGAGQISKAVTLSLDAPKGGPFIVTLMVDATWLQAPERSYPVRIDPTIDISPYAVSLVGVEQGSPNLHVGDNSYPYAGYDDGYVSGNLPLYGSMHMMCRTYAFINYDFSYIMAEAKINSATFSLYHYTAWSGGGTNFGLFRMEDTWDSSSITWNSQISASHQIIEYKQANANAGYVSWDVREVVNNWVQGIYPQRGFVVKASDERNMQCEVFSNKNSGAPPQFVINWEVPDPVDEGISLDSTTINLRPVTEKDVAGKLIFDGVFADGTATPRSLVDYRLVPKEDTGQAEASRSYKYPDSTSWTSYFPNGTKYKDKLSNWQTKLFGGLDYDKAYKVLAAASLGGVTGREAESEKFLIYKVKQKDTLPYIAKYYGVTLNTIAQDNHVQDTLVIDNNTLFIRNPNTEVAYNPPPLTDDQKREIDSALMGRGMHCEFGFEPINLNTGNFLFEATDATITDLGGEFAIARTYNSKGERYQSSFGRGWNFEYEESLSELEDGTIIYSTGDGKMLYFHPDGAGGYTSPEGYNLTLEKIPYEEEGVTYYRWQIHESDGAYKDFNGWGLLTSIVTAKGHHTTFTYDENFCLSALTSPSGKVYEFTSDAYGRFTQITLPDGNTLGYAYDNAGDLVTFTNQAGNTVRYEYDTDHCMISWYDEKGVKAIVNEYDAEGRVVRQTDALGNTTALAYAPGTTTATDARGNTTIYTYDDTYRTTEIIHPDGEVETRSYGANDTLASDAGGSYTYDVDGNKTSAVAVDGSSIEMSYNGLNLPVSITDQNGDTRALAYDAKGNLCQASYSDGTGESYTYDDLSRELSHTNQEGNTEYFTYEGANLTSHIDFLGNTTTYAYNTMGRLVSTTDALGNILRITYDAVGNITGEQDAAGAYSAFALDAVGNKTAITDGRGYTTNFAYDAMRNISSATDADGNITTFIYDANGNLISETNAAGATITYTYDSRSRMESATDAEGATTTYAYDSSDNITWLTDDEGASQETLYDLVSNMPTRFTDKEGNTTNFSYSSLGQLVLVTNPDGTTFTSSYDARGRLIQTTDERGLITTVVYTPTGNIASLNEGGHLFTYDYDALGNLIKTTDAAGQVASYVYDALGHLTSETNEAGHEATYTYDGVGRVLASTDREGNTTTYTYDASGNTQSITDAKGNVTSFIYDGLNRLCSTTDALGNTTSYTYDAAENLASTTQALGQTTSYVYDRAHRLKEVTDPLGQTHLFDYDALGNLEQSTAPDGAASCYEYDALGQLTSATDGAGLTLTYTYDSRGNTLSVASSAGASETYLYDSAGFLVSKTDALGRQASYTYDLWSNTLSETGFDTSTVSYTYDELGRPWAATNALGATVTYTYGSTGNITSETEQATGAVTTHSYDKNGRLISTTDANGNATTYDYDAVGNLTVLSDELGQAILYDYSATNQLTSVTDANGHTTSYSYDALARITSRTRPGGDTSEYVYDALDRLVQTKDGTGALTQFTYDAADNVILATDALGASTSYAYDAHGFVTATTDALGATTDYEVDQSGNVTKLVRADGAMSTYVYDVLDRMTHATTPKGFERTFAYDVSGNIKSETDSLGRTTYYTYDALHNLLTSTNPAGATAHFTYDLSNRLVARTDEAGATTTYAYDVLSQLTALTDAAGNTRAYAYDGAGSLISEVDATGVSTTYAYDAVGNLASATDGRGNTTSYAFDANDRLVRATDATGSALGLNYDEADRIVSLADQKNESTSYSYDGLGNLTSTTNALGNTTSYSYDVLSRLVQVNEPGSRQTSIAYDEVGNITEVKDARGQISSYTYDAEDNLTSVKSPTGAIESFEYDLANRLLSATDLAGAKTSYDYDQLDQLIETSYSTEAGKTVLLSYDARGLRTNRADQLGNASYEYDALGRIVKETDANGRSVAYTYDTSDRLSAIIYADGQKVSYGYDEVGNLTRVSDGTGTSRYEYDELNRPVLLTRPDGSKTIYAYDERSSVMGVKNYDSTGVLISSYAYTYDERGFVVSEQTSTLGPNGAVTTAMRTFSYTECGEVASFSETVEGSLVTTAYEYAYDGAGNRTKETISADGSTSEEIAYTFDADNRLTGKVSTKEGATTYRYDTAGNLTSEQAGGKPALTYEYTVEDRLSVVREGGRLLMAASYDGDGNRVFQVNRYTAPVSESSLAGSGSAGEAETNSASEAEGLRARGLAPTSAGVQTEDTEAFTAGSLDAFFYGVCQGIVQYSTVVTAPLLPHASNWLNRIWLPSTSNTHPIKETNELSQDDIDALYEAKLTDEDVAELASALSRASTTPLPGDTSHTAINYELTYYLNTTNAQNTQVLSEYGRQNTLRESYTYGNTRLGVQNVQEGTSYYTNDGRGSVSALVAMGGGVKESYEYDAFGAVLRTKGGELPYYGYNAEEANPTTGFQYLRARYLDSTDARFNVQDSVLGSVASPTTLNRYLYASSNPLMLTDPSGHWGIFSAIAGAVASVAKVVVGAVSAAASWVNNNVIKPVVSWVSNNIIKPVAAIASYAASASTRFVQTVYNGAAQLYTAAGQAWNSATSWVATQAESIRQQVVAFSCGVAEHVSSAWESAVETLAQVDWAAVGQVALITVGVVVGVVATVVTCGAAGPLVAGIAIGLTTVSTVLAVNDVIEITTGFDPLREGATVLGVPEDVYNVARGVVDVATMLTPGGGAASGARVASNVVGHADDVARVVAGSVDDVARVAARSVDDVAVGATRTVDLRTGEEVGRFIVDPRGNAMIEPVGGRTIEAGVDGANTYTLYPNGSNYQRLEPTGHWYDPTPHGHGHLEGTAPNRSGQGESLDVLGNLVPNNSPEAHWQIK